MEYYHIELYLREKQICTIVIPWVNYDNQKLYMEVCNIPDIFQEKIYEIFEGLVLVHVYIHNVIVITKHIFVDHMKYI